uniref:Retrotransposon protein, putative, Ty3-gypsy subclass n=2 Tax=Oryza sativa subsp. japonica TaxID=39947 RepID=Q2QMB0_ORYSJ|nr:retrotransposon protein, putative, Ty3-gypsy subclass [Oryza sativa Japonica Group]
MDISRSLFRRIASRDDNCSDKQKGKYDDIDELKDVAQVDKQLERYQRDTLRAIRPQQVYCMGFFENKNGLYRISREVELSVLTKPVELKIVAKEFENSLKYSGYKYIHQESSDRDIIDNRRHSISELMEKLDHESEIKYYEDKLRDIADEYNNSMKKNYPGLRNKKKEKSLAIETPRTQEIKIEQIKSEEPREEIQKLDKVLSEEEQWEVNEKLLLESYEEENNLIEEIENIEEEDNAEQYNDFIDSLDEEGLHNLDNAMEAMEEDLGTGKRKRYGEGSVKNEGERERPARAAGRWPPEKEEYSYHYIPGQYRHMGTKRRDFEKPIKFQNQKSDGAILNLAAHDPIDWPNIISIWKGLIVQKYIQNQHNIGNKVEDMITYLETFLGESAKVLWEQWVEKNPNNYEELKRAGSNPHNFANIVSNIIIAEDPELGYTTLQNERLKEIEKLTLTSWKECIGLQAFAPNWYRDIKSKKDIEKIVQRLEDIQIIGEIPMKYWEKNAIECKINIINPEYIIKTSPIEATPKDIEEFKMHIEELLKLGAIRESRSPHRSAAFIVRNHAEEVRGKSRMVINYKRLNDNTIEDAYNIPNKQEWINRIQGSKYFSKFDLKTGFWQVKMAEESIEWTAFTCPQGHYEWLVMPLGLKNAPALFQRKMQNIFNDNQEFVLVYIDDLLIFSKTYKDHIAHLELFFRKVEQNGLILSKKKMEIYKEKVNFLGHEIGEGKIHLQEHIAKKILQFPDAMNDKKKLQQFLGLVNYARNHINNLAKLAGPLYAKLRKNGQKYFNSEDIKLVRLIKEKVKELKPLELPLEESYFIIETDASQQGMKRSMNYAGVECFTFGDDNKLRIFPPNSYKFKPKDHIILDEVQECILDNFWYQYNNKREEKGYLLSILNSLSEYFHLINGSLMPANEDHEVIQQKPIYVVFDGKLPGVYISFEEIVAQKIDAKLMGGISWKKYKDIDEALSQARKILGINYYLEPAAKEYIQKCKKAKGKKTSEIPVKMTIKEEGFFKKPTYKECLTKGVDPLDGEYIDWKIIEKFEEASPQLKKELKEEILKELKQEMDQKFEQIKKAVDEKLEVSFSDLDTMDLGGHGQPDE